MWPPVAEQLVSLSAPTHKDHEIAEVYAVSCSRLGIESAAAASSTVSGRSRISGPEGLDGRIRQGWVKFVSRGSGNESGSVDELAKPGVVGVGGLA
jgi:hypothetical protein